MVAVDTANVNAVDPDANMEAAAGWVKVSGESRVNSSVWVQHYHGLEH